MTVSRKLINIITSSLCHFEDINLEIECHPLESDTRGGPPPRPPLVTPVGPYVYFRSESLNLKSDRHLNRIIMIGY